MRDPGRIPLKMIPGVFEESAKANDGSTEKSTRAGEMNFTETDAPAGEMNFIETGTHVGVTAAGVLSVGGPAAASYATGPGLVGSDEMGESSFEGSLVKPAARHRPVLAKTMVSLGAVASECSAPAVSSRLDDEAFANSLFEKNGPREKNGEDGHKDHLGKQFAPSRLVSDLANHAPWSIDQQSSRPLLAPSTSRVVISSPELREEDFETFGGITESSPFVQASLTLNQERGNFLEDPVFNQSDSSLQSEGEEQGRGREAALPSDVEIVRVDVDLSHYHLLKDVEQRYPLIFSNLISISPWLTRGILDSFATLLKDIRSIKVDASDAPKIKAFLHGLKDFEEMGVDIIWIHDRLEEAERLSLMETYARELEDSKALVVRKRHELAELEANVARRENELFEGDSFSFGHGRFRS